MSTDSAAMTASILRVYDTATPGQRQGWRDSAAMTASILRVYDTATPGQRQAGASWYGDASRIADAIAANFGRDKRTVATVIAALSPRNPWRWNVADAANFVAAYVTGEAMPTATTFTRNRDAAWRALMGDEAWKSDALKVRAFRDAIMGDGDAVVIDTWSYRVATGHGPVRRGSFRASEYAAIAAAYRLAALVAGVTPAVMQATTWVVTVEAEGLNVHGTIKAGTSPAVQEMLA